MPDRPLNWHGWSVETIAAVYESDQAAIEGNPTYAEAAFRAEMAEAQIDQEQRSA